ncbi:Vps53-like protein [Auriculariales sp. MPI-PUGE-AT-0066]|nr:Vps53-like protein [Auriculariales sp. MPI-PUGE-AT-0066]
MHHHLDSLISLANAQPRVQKSCGHERVALEPNGSISTSHSCTLHAAMTTVTGELPPELAQSILRVLDVQHEDELERLADFDPVPPLNALFPDHPSLSQIEAIQGRLREDERALQEQIDELYVELRRDQDPGRMQLIQEMIGDLFAQMNRIREKATESEAIVRDITKDIQVLDLAKRNLVTSMTTLKRFQMLVNALGQLDEFVAIRRYPDIARTLEAVKQISAHFKGYQAVDRVSVVTRRIQEVQGRLRTMLEEDFDTFMLQDPSKPIKLSVISDACLVVDVLGEDVRNHFIEKYCSLELKDYRRIFKSTDEAGQLDNVSRRFAWFRRVLTTCEEENGAVFPESWKVGQHLCAKFSQLTRDDLVGLLQKAAPTLTVTALLDALQHVLDFESAMSKTFKVPMGELVKVATFPLHTPKTISSAFEPHMSVFVDAQDKALADMLAPYRGASRARTSIDLSATESAAGVLPSSTELFYFYGQNLDQCAKLSTHKPLFDLCTLHRKWLRIYAEDVLLTSLKLSQQPDRGRKSTDSRSNVNELIHACTVINTAEYCHVTASELEDKIKEKISDDFKEKVTLQVERDLFMSVISSAMVAILRELDTACEPCFRTMSTIMWAQQDAVHGQSGYVAGLVNAIDTVAEAVRAGVEQKKYLRNFLDKAANLIITRFTACLVKSRPLRDVGAEQILLDLQTIKACLLKLPGPQQQESLLTSCALSILHIGSFCSRQLTDDDSHRRFSRGITKSTSSIENLLKVVMAPVDPAEGFIQNYLVLIGDSSFANFQKVLDLKGTPRSEANALVDRFITTTSTRDDLQGTSLFLSALDMDPNIFSPIKTISPNASTVNLGVMSSFSAVVDAATAEAGRDPVAGSGVGGQKREVLADLRRFMTFAIRRDKDNGSPSVS